MAKNTPKNNKGSNKRIKESLLIAVAGIAGAFSNRIQEFLNFPFPWNIIIGFIGVFILVAIIYGSLTIIDHSYPESPTPKKV